VQLNHTYHFCHEQNFSGVRTYNISVTILIFNTHTFSHTNEGHRGSTATWLIPPIKNSLTRCQLEEKKEWYKSKGLQRAENIKQREKETDKKARSSDGNYTWQDRTQTEMCLFRLPIWSILAFFLVIVRSLKGKCLRFENVLKVVKGSPYSP